MKKLITIMLSGVMAASLLAGCGASAKGDQMINVVSREDGSGTRGAFIELFGLQVKSDDGSKKDTTTKEAIIANKTDVMLMNVGSDANAIGYVSLGSLSDTIKAVSIDGVPASVDNVKKGSYKISRPFNIAVTGTADGLKKDFIDFILSAEGQAVVAKSYIAVDENAPAYSGSKPSGKLVVAGSSSVSPIMEKLKEAYVAVNPDATIEVQMSDSTAGMTGALDGTCDIGMASRELSDNEKGSLTGIQIALDGIAVIVNSDNAVSDMTSENVRRVFSGEITTWATLK